MLGVQHDLDKNLYRPKSNILLKRVFLYAFATTYSNEKSTQHCLNVEIKLSRSMSKQNAKQQPWPFHIRWLFWHTHTLAHIQFSTNKITGTGCGVCITFCFKRLLFYLVSIWWAFACGIQFNELILTEQQPKLFESCSPLRIQINIISP